MSQADVRYQRHLAMFTSKTAIPKGTTDVVMSRLFPEKRSEVRLDEFRAHQVYDILMACGAIGPPLA